MNIIARILEVEAAVDADTQCTTTCTNGDKCGGPKGLVSVYTTFKAFSTLDLFLDVSNLQNDSIATTALNISTATKPVSTGEVNIRY